MCQSGPSAFDFLYPAAPRSAPDHAERDGGAPRGVAPDVGAGQHFRTLRAIRLAAPAAVVVPGRKQRTIFDAHNTQDLPGDVVRGEGVPASAPPPRGAADYRRYTISVTSPGRNRTAWLTGPSKDSHARTLVGYLEAKARELRAS